MSSPRSRPTLNLENFLSAPLLNGRVLTSPRSIEVCFLNGIEPHELLPRSLDSFDTGNIPRAIVQRRWEHYEDKRQQKLDFLRQERRELIDHPPETSQPRQSFTPQTTPSPARVSAQQNHEMQKLNYELGSMEREKKFNDILAKSEDARELAEIRRATKDERTRAAQELHWETVVGTHHLATTIQAKETRLLADVLQHKEQLKEAQVQRANLFRRSSSARLAAERDRRVMETRAVGKGLEVAHREKMFHKCQTNEEKSERCENYKRAVKEVWGEKGAQNSEHVAEVYEAAQRRLDEQTLHKCSKIHAKEEKFEAKCMEQLQAKAEREKQKAAEAEEYEKTLKRADSLLKQKIRKEWEQQLRKELRIMQTKEDLTINQILNCELKREAENDHIEHVTRNRRASEYQRLQQLKAKYGL